MTRSRIPLSLILCASVLQTARPSTLSSVSAHPSGLRFSEEAMAAPALLHTHRLIQIAPYVPALLTQQSPTILTHAILLVPISVERLTFDHLLPLPLHRKNEITHYLQNADEETMRSDGIPKPYRNYILLLREKSGEKHSLYWWHQRFKEAFLYSGDQAIARINKSILIRENEPTFVEIFEYPTSSKPTTELEQRLHELVHHPLWTANKHFFSTAVAALNQASPEQILAWVQHPQLAAALLQARPFREYKQLFKVLSLHARANTQHANAFQTEEFLREQFLFGAFIPQMQQPFTSRRALFTFLIKTSTELGVTAAELSHFLGKPRTTVLRYLNGKQIVPLDILHKLLFWVADKTRTVKRRHSLSRYA